MARIAYSMSGEGRGHATRVRAVVEELRKEHEITLYTYGHAHDLLAPAYEGTDVSVRRIPGLCFRYSPKGNLDFGRTALGALHYLCRFPHWLSEMSRELKHEQPDLVITDFEPLLARAAKRSGVPFISLSHQHFLLVSDLSTLPLYLRIPAWLMGWVVRAYHSGQRETIVSSFYFPPIKRGFRNVTQIGVLLRPEIVNAHRDNHGHLLAYLRRFAPRHVLDALRATGRRVLIYGQGERPSEDNLEFRPTSVHQFVEDLAGCDSVICTAGNQLVGEALYLGKPVLAFPEPYNFEQYINAHFLRDSGAGDWLEMHELSAERIDAFLKQHDRYVANIDSERLNGTRGALRIIARHLPGGLGSTPAEVALSPRQELVPR